MKFLGTVGRGTTRTNQLDFGGSQGHDPDIFHCPMQLISLCVEGISSYYSVFTVTKYLIIV